MDNTLTLKLERANESHVDRFLDIQNRSDRAIGDPVPLTRADLLAMRLWDRMGPDGLQAIVDDDRVVGMLRYMKFLDAEIPLILSIVCVDPDFRDAGIADWAYERVVERAKQDDAVCLDTVIDRKDKDAYEFLKRRDFELLVSIWTMESDTDFAPNEKPQVPAGYSLRTYRTGTDAAQLADLYNRTFHHHVGFAPATVAEMQGFEQSELFDPSLTVFVMNEKGQEIAFSRNTLRGDAGDGWVDILGVLPEYQSRGLGRYLLLYSMYRLAQARPKIIRLAVEGKNDHARALYDSEGFLEIKTRWRFRKRLKA